MNCELSSRLVKRFPGLYQGYGGNIRTEGLAFGFQCGDGWFHLLWQLSLAIEEELKYTAFQKWLFLAKRRTAWRWNRLIYFLSPVVYDQTERVGQGTAADPFRTVVIEKAKARWPWVKRLAWFPFTGYAVQQVKEKFGTLRFYAPGGKQIDKFVHLAERLSSIVCEECGERGELQANHGWYSTLCKRCRKDPDDGLDDEN